MKHQIDPSPNHIFTPIVQTVSEIDDATLNLGLQFSINSELYGNQKSIFVFLRGGKTTGNISILSALIKYSDVWLAIGDAGWDSLVENRYDVSMFDDYPMAIYSGSLNVLEFPIDKSEKYGKIELNFSVASGVSAAVIAAGFVNDTNEQPEHRAKLESYSYDRQPLHILFKRESPKSQSEMS